MYGIPITMGYVDDISWILKGPSWREIGRYVIHPYKAAQTLVHESTRLKRVSLMLDRAQSEHEQGNG